MFWFLCNQGLIRKRALMFFRGSLLIVALLWGFLWCLVVFVLFLWSWSFNEVLFYQKKKCPSRRDAYFLFNHLTYVPMSPIDEWTDTDLVFHPWLVYSGPHLIMMDQKSVMLVVSRMFILMDISGFFFRLYIQNKRLYVLDLSLMH